MSQIYYGIPHLGVKIQSSTFNLLDGPLCKICLKVPGTPSARIKSSKRGHKIGHETLIIVTGLVRIPRSLRVRGTSTWVRLAIGRHTVQSLPLHTRSSTYHGMKQVPGRSSELCTVGWALIRCVFLGLFALDTADSRLEIRSRIVASWTSTIVR